MSERPRRNRTGRPEVQPDGSTHEEEYAVSTDERAELRKPGRFAHEPQEPVFDYDADMEINLNFLHLECQNHSVLFMKYAKESARTKKYASFAEERVKTKRSLLVKEANDDPDRCLGKGIKPTAPNVEAYYRTHPEYIKIKQEWIEAVYEADVASNCVFGMQGRKSMLELEVKLHGQQYYSTPEVENLSEASKQFAELKTKSVEDRIRDQTNRRG